MIILVTMIFLIVRGVVRGFFREIGALAGVVLGIWLANKFQPQMTVFLKGYLPTVSALPLISFACLFVVVFLLCNLGGAALKMALKKAFLGWTDRALGAGLAVLKGVIIIYLAIVLLTFFVPSKAPLIAKSRLAPFVISSYQSMVNLISPDAYQAWKKKFLGVKRGAKEVLTEKVRDLSGKNGIK